MNGIKVPLYRSVTAVTTALVLLGVQSWSMAQSEQPVLPAVRSTGTLVLDLDCVHEQALNCEIAAWMTPGPGFDPGRGFCYGGSGDSATQAQQSKKYRHYSTNEGCEAKPGTFRLIAEYSNLGYHTDCHKALDFLRPHTVYCRYFGRSYDFKHKPIPACTPGNIAERAVAALADRGLPTHKETCFRRAATEDDLRTERAHLEGAFNAALQRQCRALAGDRAIELCEAALQPVAPSPSVGAASQPGR